MKAAAQQAVPDGSGAPASDEGGMMVVGRVAGAYGVRGWVRVTSYTDPRENILGYGPWHLRSAEGPWREAAVETVLPHGDGYRCRVAGVTDRDAAAALRGALVGVAEAVLPPAGPDEYYWRDLIGLTVTTVTGEPLGRVDNLMATGANDALVVRDPERERLVPFIEQVVREVDLARGVITVDWDKDF